MGNWLFCALLHFLTSQVCIIKMKMYVWAIILIVKINNRSFIFVILIKYCYEVLY